MSYTAEDFARRESAIVEAGKRNLGPSIMDRLVALSEADRDVVLGELSALDCARLLYDWRAWARPKQLAPNGAWTVWLLLAGRGFGKTRTGAEWVRDRVEAGVARSVVIIGPDWKDLRRYQVGGHRGLGGSGLLDVCPPWNKPQFLEQKGELHWPNGAVAYLQTAERSELRGANLDTIWGDEPIKWRYAEALWDNIEMTLREPGRTPPQIIVTTTPTPMQLLRDLIMDEGTVVTHGVTDENEANVSPQWLARMKRRYAGTRVGQQELEARVLGDNPDALFHMSLINAHRVVMAPDLLRVLVGVDPAVSERRSSDETGLVVAGADHDVHAFVLADASGKMSPDAWAKAAVDLAVLHHADGFVVERNKVGDLAAHTIRQELRRRQLDGKYEILEAYSMIDKAARAAPVAALYEQGKVHHVGRSLGELEAEISSWNPKLGRSPNRLDAMVHAIYELTRITEEPPEDKEKLWAGLGELNKGFVRHGGRRTI